MNDYGTNGEFDVAVEILAQLIEAGLIDSPGMPVRVDPHSASVRRQGVKYQHSQFSGNDIVAWIIDISSWGESTECDWVDHIDNLDGQLPIVLMTGHNWALSVRVGQGDSEVPRDLKDSLKNLLPSGYVQWGGWQDPEWFAPKYSSAREILAELTHEGYEVEVEPIDPGLDPYLNECLEDDTFAFFRVSVPNGPAAIGCILIEIDFAANAASALDSYLDSTEDSATIAADGWVLRILRTQDPAIDCDAYAEQIAETLGATHSKSAFVELHVEETGAEIDSSTWGPQSRQMKNVLLWASRHYLAVPQESWDDERLTRWDRITSVLEKAQRLSCSTEAERIMYRIATNDFFDHTGVEALRALSARDLISVEDYDEFTLPWRSKVGRIHAGDADVALTSDARIWQGRKGKY